MKKILLSAWLLLSGLIGLAQTQPRGIYNLVAQTQITFANDLPVNKISHDNGVGAAIGGFISVPYGYSVSWRICPHGDSTTTTTSGTTRGISTNITFLGVDKVKENQYDLWVYSLPPPGSGFNAIARVFPSEWIVYPIQVNAGNADVNIDLGAGGIGAYNGGWTDYAATGRKIYIHGTYTGTTALNFFYWLSTNPLKPVIFAFDNVVLNIPTAQAFRFGSNQGVVIDGSLHDDVTQKYGLISNNCKGENFYLTIGDDTHQSKWWMITGMHAQNINFTNGGGGFVIQSIGDATINDSNYRFDKLLVTNVLLENSNSEGFYIFHTTDNDVPAWSKGTNLYFVRCHSDGARNENFQIGGCLTGEVFLCKWTNGGVGQENGQMNNFVYKYGNTALQVYMNYSVSKFDAFQSFPGITGTSTFTYNNIISNVGGTNVNYLYSIQQLTSGGNTAAVTVGNTMLFNTLAGYELYNDASNPPTTTLAVFNSGWNVICSNTTSPSQINGGYVTSSTILADLTYANTTTAGFTNAAKNDFRPSSTSSPMLGVTYNSTVKTAADAGAYYSHYDYEGKLRMQWKPSAGAYGGSDLYTH